MLYIHLMSKICKYYGNAPQRRIHGNLFRMGGSKERKGKNTKITITTSEKTTGDHDKS